MVKRPKRVGRAALAARRKVPLSAEVLVAWDFLAMVKVQYSRVPRVSRNADSHLKLPPWQMEFWLTFTFLTTQSV